MSIALSASVRSSLRLRRLLRVYAAVHLLAALLLAGHFFGRGASGHSLRWRTGLGLACGAVAGLAWRRARRPEMTHQIDISGPGELRLTVQQSMGDAVVAGRPVQLLAGSTLWPGCLVLRLRARDDGAITVLTVLPDSLSPRQFRALAVALRVIAGQDNKFAVKHKIL